VFYVRSLIRDNEEESVGSGRFGERERSLRLSEELTLDELADALIEECEKDIRKALLITLRLNDYLMRENNRLIRTSPPGLTRGSGGHKS
jgi:hypothetical protein